MHEHAWGPVLVLIVMLGLLVAASMGVGEASHGGSPPAPAPRDLDVEALVESALDAALLGCTDAAHREILWGATSLPL